MGVVIRQSFWNSVLIYAGVAIGYLNTLVLMPYFLGIDLIGLVRLIQSNGMILVPLVLIGMNGSYLKFFPRFNTDSTLRNRIFSFQIVLIAVSVTLVILLAFGWKEWLATAIDTKNTGYFNYLSISAVILVSQSFFHFFMGICQSEKSTIMPTFLNEFAIRVLTLLCLIGFGLNWLSFDQMLGAIALCYVAITLFLLFYTFWKYSLRWDWHFYRIEWSWLKPIFNFGLYTMILTTSSSILLNVTYPQVNAFLGLEANGIITISIFITTIIEMPRRAVIQIAAPLVSQFFSEKNYQLINQTYQRASLNLTLISLLLTIGIITNIQDLYLLVPQGSTLQAGFWAIVILSASRVVTMCFGIAAEILTYSKYYLLNLLIAVGGSSLLILLNIWLIPAFGLEGAAWALFITTAGGMLARALVLQIYYGFSPFTRGHLYLLLLTIPVFLMAWYIPLPWSAIINIACRSILTGAIFLGAVYFLRISDEVNSTAAQIIQKIKQALF